MKNTAIEKLSYTEVTKNISQAEYNQTQEEYILSKSPDKYMISLPVKVLMFEGAKDSSPFTYYFYMENDEDLYLMQRKRNGSIVDKTKIPLTKEQGQKILDGDYQFLLDSDECEIPEESGIESCSDGDDRNRSDEGAIRRYL